MPPKFGPAGNSNSFYQSGKKHSYEAPEWISSFGLDCYEYSAGNGIPSSFDTFNKIGQAAKENQILLSLHTPYYISLSGTDPEKRLKSLDYIEKSLNACKAMGGDIIVIHTGSASKISRAEALNLAKDTMFRALEAFPDTNIKFGLETMGKLNQLGTLSEVIEICRLDKCLCPVIDFGHMNARNIGNLFKNTDDYKRVFDEIGCLLGFEYADTLHCHFSKIEYTASGEKRHLTFDDSVYGPDFEPLMDCIYSEGYSPRIICESDGTMAEDALKMKKYYLNLKGE